MKEYLKKRITVLIIGSLVFLIIVIHNLKTVGAGYRPLLNGNGGSYSWKDIFYSTPDLFVFFIIVFFILLY